MTMTHKQDALYMAQITISLPGHPDKATAIVTLAPADMVALGDRVKPLSECTLAELSAYGEALEAEVWDTYEAISLLTLVDGSQVDIRVTAIDEQGHQTAEIGDWLKQAIVLAPASVADEPVQSEVVAEKSEPAAENVHTAQEPNEPPAPPKETSPVEETTASGPTPPEAPPPTAVAKPPAPNIIPSQARVRVAGARLPLAESAGAAVDIFLDEPPLRAMQAHALSSLDREVAGVMIGRQPEKQPDGRYVVHIIDSIIAKHTVMQGASVTYTPESWRYMTDTLWERYPDESAVIVGWYHTHPGFGIFLSGMDLFIHQNFFTQTWHIAYVLDPRARTSGFFCWNRQRTKVNRYDFAWPEWSNGSW